MSHKIKKTKKRLSLSNLLHHPTLTHSRFSKANLTIFILIFAGIGGYILLKSHAVGGAANLWVDTDGGSCLRNSVTTAYDTNNACGSFQAAYAAAQPGDLVLVKAGTYGSAYINDDPAKDSPTLAAPITIQAANGETVIWGNGSQHGGTCHVNTTNNDVCASNINFVGIRFGVGGLHTHEGVNITLTNSTIGNGMYVLGTQNFKMIGGQVGPADSNGGSGDGVVLGCENSGVGIVCDDTPGKLRPTATFDGVTFTHINKTVDLAAHTDCLQTTSFKSLTIVNSSFTACADAPIILGDENVAAGYNSTLLIRNNFIGAGVGSGQGITTATRYAGSLIIEYNTIVGATNISIPVIFRGNAVSGTFSSTSCNQMASVGATLTYNVWGSGSVQCGASNYIAPAAFGFANTAADPIDLHIGQTSPLIDRGDPANCPATDIDGNSRPQGSICDAGADEYMAASSSLANVFVSANGSDTGANCVRFASPTSSPDPTGTSLCASFNKAASIASCGDTVSVQNGTYGYQAFSETNSDTCTVSTPISFIAQGTVSVKGVGGSDCTAGSANCGISLTGVSYITLDGFNADAVVFVVYNTSQGTMCASGTRGGNCYKPASYNIFKNGHCGSQWGGCRIFADHDQFVNADIQTGGCPYGSDISASGGASCGVANSTPVVDIRTEYCAANTASCGPTTVTEADGTGSGFVNSKIHDIFQTNTADHLQCLGVWGAQKIVITGNKMWDCGGNQGLFFDASLTANQVSGDIENNVIGANCDPSGCGEISQSFGINNGGGKTVVNPFIFRNNSLAGTTGSFALQTVGAGGSIIFTNNIIGGSTNTCNSNSGVTQNHNFFISATGCAGDTNLMTTSSSIWNNYLNGASSVSPAIGPPDLTLTSVGLNSLQSKGSACAATDINGVLRPSSCTPGAYEYSAIPTSIPGDINSDSHVNILDLSILLSHYGQVATSSQGDLTGDGRVSILDLSILLSHYGA